MNTYKMYVYWGEEGKLQTAFAKLLKLCSYYNRLNYCFPVYHTYLKWNKSSEYFCFLISENGRICSWIFFFFPTALYCPWLLKLGTV